MKIYVQKETCNSDKYQHEDQKGQKKTEKY